MRLAFDLFVFVFSCAASLLLHRIFSSCGAGFSLGWLLLWSTGSMVRRLSSCGPQALEHRVSNSAAWAQLLQGVWGLPGPGTKPVSLIGRQIPYYWTNRET